MNLQQPNVLANKTCCSVFGYILNLYALFAKPTPAFSIFINNYIIPYYSIVVKSAIHPATYRSEGILAGCLLNKFCFSKRHDDKCNGCMFKNYKKCPLNMAVEKLENLL